VTELANEARAGLNRLIAQFDRPETPYRALRRPRFRYDYDDFAHLARVAEWAIESDEEAA
jgi:ATP-dependent helicase/nuclease subunit B